MWKLLFLLGCWGACWSCQSDPAEQRTTSSNSVWTSYRSVHAFCLPQTTGDTLCLKAFAGHKLLIINLPDSLTTHAIEDLRRIQDITDTRLSLLGTIAGERSKPDTLSFPVATKVAHSGLSRHPLYRWLSDPTLNGWNSDTTNGYFSKYLIDEEGHLLRYYDARTPPSEIVHQINQEEID
ncbi:MAG: hypothetical protein ACFCUI_09515 [Bernardetiaceae bacterium]